MHSWFLVEALAAVLAAVLLGLFWLWDRRLRIHVPGPATLPLLGNVLHFKGCVTMDHFRRLQQQYGHTFRLYVGPKLMVVVSHPDDVQLVLTTASIKEREPFVTRLLRPFIGDGVVTSSGSKWKKHRNVAATAVNGEILQMYVGDINKLSKEICNQLSLTCGQEVEAFTHLFSGFYKIVLLNLTGVQLKDLKLDGFTEKGIAGAAIRSMEIIQERLRNPFKLVPWLLALTKAGRDQKRVVHLLNSTARQVITLRKSADDLGNGSKRPTMLESFETAGLTEEEMSEELNSILFPSAHTPAHAVSYCLALLALHPEWQKSVQTELDEVFGKPGEDYHRPATIKDLAKLEVLDRVLKETLRLFPVVHTMPRILPDDLVLASSRDVVPRGCCVLVMSSLTHRLPQFFPDPGRFDPDRFLGEGPTLGHPFCYVPFGAGPRSCFGYRYANILMKVVLASLMRRFTVLPGSTMEELNQLTVSVIIHPINGIRFTLQERNHYGKPDVF